MGILSDAIILFAAFLYVGGAGMLAEAWRWL
jgi:hypothetical protein